MKGERIKYNIMLLPAVMLLFSAVPVFGSIGSPHGRPGLQHRMDILWVIIASVLVFLMQAGFMCLESGMARAKNSINVAVKNFSDFLIASIGFWIVGFGVMFGESFYGLFGTTDFFIQIENNQWRVAFFVFQVVFAGTAATIDSGAIAERTKFSGYMIMSFFISVLIYPVFGHWAWGSFLNNQTKGWLENLGFIDFAGSTVVHSIGAWVALAGVIVIGPRIGKFDSAGIPRKIHPHSLRLVYLGAFLLFFGWFGFNAGSTLRATEEIAGIIFNTIIAASFGGISCTLLSWNFSEEKHPEAEMIANGVIGGLVGITAGCFYVETQGAMIIGIVSGIIVFYGNRFLERTLKLDDVVGAIPVHGFAGIWGTIAAGLFITPEKLALTGFSRIEQTGIQILGVCAAFLWAFTTAFILLTLLNRLGLLRVSAEDEKLGLNVSQHGAHSSILELTSSMKMIAENDLYNDSLKVWAEQGTEAGDLAHYFNRMVDTLKQRHNKEKGILEEKKNHIENTFGKYVAPQVRDKILEGYTKLGGEKMDATVLFCDIRNFTKIAEKLSPSKVVDLLNSFFNEMIKPVIDNHGILDKFIGDSIMAVFGPFSNKINHADCAVRTAITMVKKLEAFNKIRIITEQEPIGVGIGINTGEVIVGNIGSKDRMEYTVIGDTVNIASRLESLTKKSDSSILYSEFTYESLKDGPEFQHREVGTVRVRGREQPFRVYKPVYE